VGVYNVLLDEALSEKLAAGTETEAIALAQIDALQSHLNMRLTAESPDATLEFDEAETVATAAGFRATRAGRATIGEVSMVLHLLVDLRPTGIVLLTGTTVSGEPASHLNQLTATADSVIFDTELAAAPAATAEEIEQAVEEKVDEAVEKAAEDGM
jgi:hypothetical protein